MPARLRLIPIVVLLLVTLGADKVQAAADCPDPPGTAIDANDRIECTEDSTSTDDIGIDLDEVAITTSGDDEHGISADHSGNGNIDIDTQSVTITTTADGAHGIHATHSGTGNINVNDVGSTIQTGGTHADGIRAEHSGTGRVDIDVDGSTFIITGSHPHIIDGSSSNGVYGRHGGPTGIATGNLTIDVDNATISTSGTGTGTGGHGVFGDHSGLDQNGKSTDLVINVQNSNIMTSGSGAFGITSNRAEGTGNVDIDVLDTTITVDRGRGIDARLRSAGDIDIYSKNNMITTTGSSTLGIQAYVSDGVSEGNVLVNVQGGSITTSGINSIGIRGIKDGIGTTRIKATDLNIMMEYEDVMGTTPREAYGIHSSHTGTGLMAIDLKGGSITTKAGSSIGVYSEHKGLGDIRIDLQDISITTESTTSVNAFGDTLSHGIYAYHGGSGDIDIDTDRAVIETKGAFSHGIIAQHEGAGNINLDIRGGSIKTAGEYAYGIFGALTKTDHGGTISIRTGNGNAITTTGDNGHGIVAYNYGTLDTRTINIDVGGTVTTSGAGAQGVRVGVVNASNVVERAAGFDAEGYRKQTVTVNGAVTSAAEGVFLAGGGRVIIGSKGVINSLSKIAILATGDNPGDLKPKLRVDLNLGGRKVAKAIGDNWIINDGGETTIAVNNTVLHDGEGVTGDTARNGAWNVRMRKHGVKVNRTDPANWMFTESTDDADPIIADRDFSTKDFTETRRPLPPPSSCPDGQMGTPPDCTDAETDTDTDTEMPMFMEEYAPRSAVYESLPGFLLRMADRGRLNHRPVSPVWMVFSGGDGSVDPSRSTTGAEYDYDRYRVQLGKNLIFGEGLAGWFAVHHIQGDSDVSSPTGGGDIDAEGAGAAFNIQWQHASGYYLGGSTSFTAYDVDLSSDDIGRLRSSVDALGVSLGFETGMRLAMGTNLHLTPRAWLSHSSIDIDSFTDAVDAKASFPDEVRLTGGIGALAQTLRHWKGGELTWHGSLDLEQMLNSRSTSVDVSGEQLKTETVSTRLLLGLGSLYRKGDFSISAQVAASGLGTNDEDYSGQVNIGVRL